MQRGAVFRMAWQENSNINSGLRKIVFLVGAKSCGIQTSLPGAVSSRAEE